MSNFALSNINAVFGKQKFYQLKIDGVNVLDSFENELESAYKTEFERILSWMNHVANLKPAPQKKFRDITPESEIIKEFEFKSRHLRIYAIKDKNSKIVVFCGFKNSQTRDIRKFRNLKAQYLKSIK